MGTPDNPEGSVDRIQKETEELFKMWNRAKTGESRINTAEYFEDLLDSVGREIAIKELMEQPLDDRLKAYKPLVEELDKQKIKMRSGI